MRLPSMQTLQKVAIITGFVGVSGCMYLRSRVIDGISKSTYFREAFKVLREDPSAIKLLGEPIKQLSFDLSDDDNYCDGRYAQFHVRVKGSNDKGMMYFWAFLNEDRKWTVNRVELELNKHPGKRLLVKTEYTPEQETSKMISIETPQ